jgi:hypothetical protein
LCLSIGTGFIGGQKGLRKYSRRIGIPQIVSHAGCLFRQRHAAASEQRRAITTQCLLPSRGKSRGSSSRPRGFGRPRDTRADAGSASSITASRNHGIDMPILRSVLGGGKAVFPQKVAYPGPWCGLPAEPITRLLFQRLWSATCTRYIRR